MDLYLLTVLFVGAVITALWILAEWAYQSWRARKDEADEWGDDDSCVKIVTPEEVANWDLPAEVAKDENTK